MILHYQKFGINIDEGFPEPDEDGRYPNGDDDATEKADQIDVLVTDENVDDIDEPDDDEDLCEESES